MAKQPATVGEAFMIFLKEIILSSSCLLSEISNSSFGFTKRYLVFDFGIVDFIISGTGP